MEIIFLLLTFLHQNLWLLFQIVFLIVLIVFIRKFKFTAQKIGMFGFFTLFVVMILIIFRLDIIAGRVAEFVWILFTISFIQQFYHFLKHENK